MIYDVQVTISNRIEASSLADARRKYAEQLSDDYFTCIDPCEVEAHESDDQSPILVPKKEKREGEPLVLDLDEIRKWDIDSLIKQANDFSQMFIMGKR